MLTQRKRGKLKDMCRIIEYKENLLFYDGTYSESG
jgi:hypothetical protein